MRSRWSIPSPRELTRLLLFAGLWLFAGEASAQSDIVTFSRGSLIIPEQASFQTGCGSISAYGLVWRLLQSNEPGGYNESHPVTVYWVINNSKSSPNRCVPTNRHTSPSPNNGSWNDPRWNDGCDLVIRNDTQQPVVPVNAAVAPGAGGMYPTGNLPNYTTSAANVRPAFNSITLNDTVTPRFTTIQYMGGPFVIDAADAPNVLGFLRSATDPAISQYRNSCTCNTFPTAGCRFVQMHQATVQFTAPVSKRINKLPPKIALLDMGTGVSAGILDDYLTNAGLNFTGAAGCPAGTFSGCGTNGGQPGKIYDRFHANADLISTAAHPHGLLNTADARGRPLYRVFWAPHWVSNDSSFSQYVANGDGSANQKANALNNIAYYANRKGTGLFAECASLESYEGSYEGGALRVAQATPATAFHYTRNIDTNGLSSGNDWDGRNCTDPDYLALPTPRPQCVIYPNPADPFSQLGDFRYNSTGGHVHNYRPNPSPVSTYQPGLKRLAVSWRNYQSGDFPANASAHNDNNWDFFTLRLKDNDTNKATIVYLAGHSYTDTVPGNRIVLNTLMNLGADPVGQERALSAPVAYDDPNGTDTNGTRALVLAPTFEAVTGYPPGVDLYVHAMGSQWVFPYVPGHLRTHSLIGGTALAAGASALDAATLWDADERMPLPAQRNLFTYFGGRFVSPAPLGPAARVRNDVLQVGWVPEKVAGTTLNGNFLVAPNPGCVDVLKMGRGLARDGTYRFDLVEGADGVCDLQEAMQYTALNPGSDFGVSELANNLARLLTDLPALQQMLQRVRGHCFATTTRLDGSGAPILEPSDLQCNNADADNRAHLGGLVHSSPAVIPPSPNIQDNGAPRPTVAYVGGFDGQLHALYVSGGAGYTGPRGGRTSHNTGASTKFSVDWAQRFASNSSLPQPGTELWSFLPATQLPWLKSNSARVDSTPVVQDVFADFTGNGLREWRTVLVASVGPAGRDLFAMDITHPLKPVLLWHLVGSVARAGGHPPYSVVARADTSIGGTDVSAKWRQPDALFLERPATDPGRLPSGLYDYSDLGGASGLSIGQLRRGLEPVYAVFAATNASGENGVSRGLEVFSIDVATGQKLWQWEQPYTQAWADNTVPPVVSVLPGREGVSRLLVGDMEGRLWELDAGSGMNANVLRDVPGCPRSTPCALAAFDTRSTAGEPQPLTTNVSVARLPQTPTGALASYGGTLVALVGTAGADWVSGTVPGRLHVLLLDERYRKPVRADGLHLDGTAWPQNNALSSARLEGLLQEPAPFPVTFTAGSHLHGTITVAGRTAFFQTATGPVNDPMSLSGRSSGATYSMDLGDVSAVSPATQLGATSYANFGGVTVYHRDTGTSSKDFIVGQEVSRITNTVLNNTGTKGAASPDPTQSVSTNPGLMYRLLNWMQRHLR
ncbi:hypothetical protein [Pyxidicoccus sp. MSG2]|uniref:hypothetical protein n=1 Tax=Pyxidicoccus sp. MSG2 TaxID=2996790 RepID=UPI00226DD2BA|nr:hypothetical protein [Pyxidicoccus sp. MSG2]MCY1023783.1 hypothetical protein [Pyxidicoccus sp. MSG2]